VTARATELVEFLLARIAEDEVVAAELGELWLLVADAGRRRLDAGVREGMSSVFGVAHGAPAGSAPARLVAELDAKRRIVEHCSGQVPADDRPGSGPDDVTVLLLLALPYADHPAYRSEWQIQDVS
jgi:Family of unknown function (DUF6221)